MTDHTPTPWRVEENCLGVYPISAKQGPITVQPAKAFAEDDAAFIVKAANNHDALVKALEAALLIAKQEWDFPGAHPHRAAVVRDMEDALAHVSGAGDDK